MCLTINFQITVPKRKRGLIKGSSCQQIWLEILFWIAESLMNLQNSQDRYFEAGNSIAIFDIEW